MLWRRGWILNSLKYRVEVEIRKTLYRNKTFLSNRWSFPERLVIFGAKHIWLTNLVFIILAVVASRLIFINYELLREIIPAPLKHLKPILDFQSTLFGAQITLLGLVFPLVIAFIGVLLQGKSSNKFLWSVYKYNSGFMLLGFSAITLTIFFVTSKALEPWLSYRETIALAVSTTIWFTINLLLTGRFLWNTMRFLELENRMEMLVKYAINDVIATDIRSRLLAHHIILAKRTGLLPESKEGLFDIETYSVTPLPNRVIKVNSQPKFIINIWYRLLGFGIWLWALQASFSNLRKVPTLCFPFKADNKSKNIIFAESSISINFLSGFLIRRSVRLSKKHEESIFKVEQMIIALFGQVEDALKENNTLLFETAKNDLERFYKEIESSMFFIDDEGQPYNWILLLGATIFGRSMLDVFVRESVRIAKVITRRMPEDATFYESWCYLYPRLFSNLSKDSPRKIAETYIDGHYYIWGSLMSRMGSYHFSDVIANQQRDRAIKHFVGSWEHWSKLIDENFNSVSQANFDIAMRHLANTSKLIIYATKYENWDAARWTTDVFVHWFELFSNFQQNYRHFGWHHELITPDILKLDVAHQLRIAISAPNDFEESEATLIALRNYWTDIRCLTAAYMMGVPQYKVDVLYKDYVEAILNSRRLEPTNEDDTESAHRPLISTRDLLGVYIRQIGHWGEQQAYNSMLENHLEDLARIEEPEWVSGRIYSSVGTKQELYLPRFFKIVGIGLTTTVFNLDDKWLGFLKSNYISQAHSVNVISDLRNLTVIDDTLLDTVCYQFKIGKEEAEQKRNLFIESINNIIADLEARNVSQIINAPIDRQRLINLGIAASGVAFTLSEGPVPISLFQHIDYVGELSSGPVITNILNHNTSEVSEGIEVNRPLNEGELLKEFIVQRLVIEVFDRLFRDMSWQSNQYEDSLVLLSQAVEDSKFIKNNGLTPIMFIGPWSLYHLIENSKWRYSRDDNRLPFDIAIESGREESYVCHLNDIEIYRIPFIKVDFSVLVPKESFRKIKIKRFGEGRYVDVNFTTKSDSDLTGTLSLTFGIECEFQMSTCFKYLSQKL
jgi:hypothetical protein